MDAAKTAAALLIGILVGIAAGYLALGGHGAATAATVTETTATTKTITSPVTVTATVTSTTVTTKVATTTTTATSVKTVVKTRVVLVDALGHTVTLPAPARRVVSLAPSITEEIVMMNLSSRLVGVDSFSKKIPGVPSTAVDVGGFWNPSPEKILAARPDLVLACSGVPQQEKMANQLSEQGVRVFFLRCDRARGWSDIAWDVSAIGTLLGAQEAAEKLNHWMTTRVEEIQRSVANETKPSIALVVYLGDKGVWIAGGGTFQDTMIATAGARNVYHSVYGWQMVSYEDLIAKNPSYIFITVMGGRDAANKTLEKIAGTPLASTKAAKEGHICIIYDGLTDAANRPSPRAVLAAQALAATLHPGKVQPPKGIEGIICGAPAAAKQG